MVVVAMERASLVIKEACMLARIHACTQSERLKAAAASRPKEMPQKLLRSANELGISASWTFLGP